MRARKPQREAVAAATGAGRERCRISPEGTLPGLRRRRLGRAGVVGLVAVRHGAGGRESGDRGRRGGRRDGGPLHQEGRAGARRHADRDQSDLQLLVLLQPLSRRLPHAGIAQPHATAASGGSASRSCTIRRPTSTPSKKMVQDQGRPQLQLRPAGALARHRHQVRQHQGLFARGFPHHAARLHDGGRSASASSSGSCRPCATAARW